MPLFRRKPADVAEDVDPALDASAEDASAEGASADLADEDATPRTRGYTPPKGRVTPKRVSTVRKVAEPPANRREAVQRRRELARANRAEAMEGMRRGDERYLPARDRGPERGLVRDIVDSRRTMGTWFFGGALLVIIGSSGTMPVQVQLAANGLWIVLALAVIVDSFLITRKIKRLVGERFPRTDQKRSSLYVYGIMRGMTFRRMRIPKPRVNLGDAV